MTGMPGAAGNEAHHCIGVAIHAPDSIGTSSASIHLTRRSGTLERIIQRKFLDKAD
jgi:hypothetical protein